MVNQKIGFLATSLEMVHPVADSTVAPHTRQFQGGTPFGIISTFLTSISLNHVTCMIDILALSLVPCASVYNGFGRQGRHEGLAFSTVPCPGYVVLYYFTLSCVVPDPSARLR